jgi:hypothetical protein
MKKTTNRLIFYLSVILTLGACSGPSSKLVGEWKGNDNRGKKNVVIFKNDNIAEWISENTILGGEHFEIEGEKAELKYEVDYSKDPIWLDLVIYRNGIPLEDKRIKGIVRFPSDTRMEWRIGMENRYITFDSRDMNSTMLLDKVN